MARDGFSGYTKAADAYWDRVEREKQELYEKFDQANTLNIEGMTDEAREKLQKCFDAYQNERFAYAAKVGTFMRKLTDHILDREIKQSQVESLIEPGDEYMKGPDIVNERALDIIREE